MEPHGPLNKIVLRPDHAGAIVEYADVNDAGKAALAVDGYEILPGRKLGVGSVKEMLAQRAEKKGGSVEDEKKKGGGAGKMQPAAPIRRPGQPVPGGRRGGLGKKVGGRPGLGATKKDNSEQAGGGKTNADFKALFVKSSGTEE